MELEEQVVNLGQIYARLCKVAKINSPHSFEKACHEPMKEITVILVQKLRGKLSKEDDEYLQVRFDDIDADNKIFYEGLPVELQGVFQVAYYQALKPKSVKELIARSGYNQNEVADLLGVSYNTVSRWSLGNSTPSAETYYKIERLKK